jgi:hypothetical protein
MQVNALVLVCDGCATHLNDGENFGSSIAARAVAYAAGWRFPHKISDKTGQAIRLTSDVCPTCLPGWQPQPRGRSHGYERIDGSTR